MGEFLTLLQFVQVSL